MFQVKGDVIEFDGKPFAVITAPISGFRMEAVDALNNYDTFIEERVDFHVAEARADDMREVKDAINNAVDEVWLYEPHAEYLITAIKEALSNDD